MVNNFKNKFFRIMKLNVILFLFSMNVVFASNSYAQKTFLTLDMKDKTVSEVLDAIEQQSEFRFYYNSKIVDTKRKVTVTAKQVDVFIILNQLFTATNIGYKVVDKDVILVERDADSSSPQLAVAFQGISITGTVTDDVGDPVPGVNVVVKGTTTGVITGSDGRFSITVPNEDAVLAFSFVGYASQEIAVGDQRTINVTLEVDARELEEVVVVGYGVQRKITVTGSISSVDGNLLTKSPAISVTNSFAGRLSGVFATNRSGEPGSNVSNVLIRGQRTLGTNSPLYVIDGVWGRGTYNELDPNDIENVTVLKDASAAIYGARAANGVILISTKRGVIGKPKINYSMNVALTQPTRMIKLANAAEYATAYNALMFQQGLPERYTDEQIAKFGDGSDPFNYPDTDWVKETIKKFSNQQRHNLSLSGGNDRVKYYVSGSYSKENSLLKKGIHDFTTYGVRSNIDAEVNKNIKIGVDLSILQANRIRPRANTDAIFQSISRSYPWQVAYYPNGLPGPGIERGENPVLLATDAGGYRKDRTNNILTNFKVDINIPWIEGLGVDGFASYDLTNTYSKEWRTPWTVYDYDSTTETYSSRIGGGITLPQLQEGSRYVNRLLLHTKIKYNRRFQQHQINAFVAVEQSLTQINNFSAFRKDFMTDAVDQLYAGDGVDQVTDGSASETAYRNFLGRISYGFKDRYLVDFNFRYDGSANFPEDSRWGFFPGISVGWRLSEEEFIANNITAINNLKIRASWGQMGNDQVDAFQYLSTFYFTDGYFLGTNRDPVKGISRNRFANPNITWEVANTYGLGIDLTLWNGLLGLTADVFKEKRSNILVSRSGSVPQYAGMILPDENIGIVENKGFEMELSHFRSKNDWQYSITGNFSFVKNKIIDIDEAASARPWQMRTGHKMGAELYYIAEGIYRSQDEIDDRPIPNGTKVGDPKYKKIDSADDALITSNDRIRLDKTNIPEIMFGLNINAGYKAFDISMLIQGQARAWQYLRMMTGTQGNMARDLAVNSYTDKKQNTNSKYPRLNTYDTEISGYQSTFWLKNSSFVRLKNLEIGYTLSHTLSSRIGIEKFRIYLSGYNLITIDQLKWWDPEGDNRAGSFYPQTRIYNIGLNLTF